MLRRLLSPPICWSGTTLGCRDDFTYRAPPQTARAKFQSLEKAIIQLSPLTAGGEFVDAGAIDRVRTCGEQGQDIFMAGFEELTGVSGGLECGFERHRRARE